MGLDALVCPIFHVRAVAWDAPDPARFDALMLTSANGAARAGPALTLYAGLDCYCVGPATAAAARGAGIGRIRTGSRDAAALLSEMEGAGIRRALWLCGRDRATSASNVQIEPCTVYASELVDELAPPAVEALGAGAIPLIHSPRAGRLFADLIARSGLDRNAIAPVAISQAAAETLGAGWRDVAIAERPRDEAMLELAAKLCKTAPMGGTDRSL